MQSKQGQTRLIWLTVFLSCLALIAFFFYEPSIRSTKASLSKVEDASRMKSEFLANMSHEIRTPMTSILGYADYLLEEGDPERAPKHRIDAINTIRRNGNFLLEIINDILDLSKIEAEKMEIEKRECSPYGLVQDVFKLMKYKANDKGLRFELTVESEIPELILTDPIRLRQILVNLIGNAMKFTEDGHVKVFVRYSAESPEQLEFDVVDSGIGMTDSQSKAIFQAFSQADTTMTRRYGGTGLGLTISKRLAKMLGGDLMLVDSVLGIGSRFRVSVATGPLANTSFLTPSCSTELGIDSSADADESAQKVSDNESLEGVRILLAEDGPDNQRLISFVLKKAGAEVEVVENGQEAVEAAIRASNAQEEFDLILMDMQMPVLDGYKATERLRGLNYEGCIIALTAHAMASDRKRCLDAGCDEFTTKPIDRVQLIELCHEFAFGDKTELLGSGIR